MMLMVTHVAVVRTSQLPTASANEIGTLQPTIFFECLPAKEVTAPSKRSSATYSLLLLLGLTVDYFLYVCDARRHFVNEVFNLTRLVGIGGNFF